MIIMPAVDMLNGRVVQLIGGRPGTEQIILPDPAEVAASWERLGAPMVHIIDLDAALGKGGNPEVIHRMLGALKVPMEVGGGIRTTYTVRQYLDWGAARVIVGTRAIEDTNWLADLAAAFPSRIVLALDVSKGKIQVKGWQEASRVPLSQMLDSIRDMPLAAVLHTDVDVEGRAQGINQGEVRSFVEQCPHHVIVSGGIRNMDDVRLLEGLGVEEAVAGLALYTGKLNPADLWRKQR